MAEPFQLGATVNEIRFGASNLAEGAVKDIPRFMEAMDETADKAAAGLVSGVKSLPALLDEDEQFA